MIDLEIKDGIILDKNKWLFNIKTFNLYPIDKLRYEVIDDISESDAGMKKLSETEKKKAAEDRRLEQQLLQVALLPFNEKQKHYESENGKY